MYSVVKLTLAQTHVDSCPNFPITSILLFSDDPSEVQKEEFLFEIAMMKVLGAHQNVLSLVGCCTLQDHKFLVIEYVPFGDLLQWLRRKRNSVGSCCLYTLYCRPGMPGLLIKRGVEDGGGGTFGV